MDASDETFEQKLRKEPLAFRVPCDGCQHLQPVAGEVAYFTCTYLPPAEVLGWMKLRAFGAFNDLTTTKGAARWLTEKVVKGPFKPDAREETCSARLAAA